MYNVFLWSFRRPTLTKKALTDLITWNKLKKIYIVIDGLKDSSSENDKFRRLETIKTINNFPNSEKIELWLYETHLDYTEHFFRTFSRALEIDPNPLWIEEDMKIDFENLNKIDLSMAPLREPFLLTGFSPFNHNQIGIRSTLFLPLYGVIFNELLFNNICNVWNKKKFDDKIVEAKINEIFRGKSINSRLHRYSTINYWKNYLSWGLKNSNRWDALAIYTLWLNKSSVYAPNQGFVTDISYLDSTNAMNPRVKPRDPISHEFKQVTSGNQIFCLSCEIENSRIVKNPLKRVVNSLTYRINHY